ncbi:sn-glycerol-3-phosphate dehydrogenase subunit C [Natrinema pellirubrum DSM 15624]|uniref:Glycerol-3-phosphate dehydrogenase, anaerobic, C subunit n=1 Tax=Natrinema pellirubrum (strain DSM 15624 / CIP 106293 / JCM 10476 / NCIMB 786 / 157) TaxID=797303 RepID=L0JK21_NATP1|nr:anaerobic glycerol-3-phosphate dehydrogenase subunit C [Natrinema pellirubrum]AGB30922.1 glycerol-3-phosphate dehydrogenase, anaerobic, C subunit [Natrinema pellirubrum DSM 15624]ELY80694.1 sn-glycerol-3-phosphate dehydrogenase subunit C [Natrinema pellirubrum DSM 15624]
MSDAERPTDDSSDEFEPIEVFPEAGETDLRPGADDCYKCSTCDTECPVAEVDDEFPGPKFQGPEQWRLKRQDDHDIDESVMKCSNCMRCDSACPSDVPLSQMHNTARAEYVEENMSKLSREYWRNRMLANYRRLAPLGAMFPRTANFVTGLSATQWLGEKLLGITSERDFPSFATETFREWWTARGGAQVENPEKRIAYFHGCYSNYNTPEVAKALVRVYEHFGYEIMVPDQDCSGTPMFANGMLEDARRAAETNVRELAAAIDEGADIVASCSSCSMSLRQEYPELFDFEDTEAVAANTWDAVEYLRVHEDLEAELEGTSVGEEFDDFAYHAPCHARNQGLDGQTVELLAAIDGVEAHDVGDSCSGISGTYGWKEENYETSMEIGAEMFDHMDEADAEAGLTECPTCSMQMEHGTGYEITHTLEVLAAALVGDGTGANATGARAE